MTYSSSGKVSFGSLGTVTSLFVIFLVGVTKFYKQFVHRLVAYLMVVNALQALCQVLELIPIEVTEDEHIIIRNGTAWSDVCAILGYLDIVTSWNGNFVVIWISYVLYAQTELADLFQVQSYES